MDLNFYQGEKSKIIGLMMASPEEFQTYAGALIDVPDGCQLVARIRSVQVGKTATEKRREILIGSAPVGQPLKFQDEIEDAAKPLAPPQVARALEIPETVKNASDADLETMAAKNGVTVTEKWRKMARPARDATVARGMADKKQAAG